MSLSLICLNGDAPEEGNNADKDGRNRGRGMLSRQSRDAIRLSTLEPGVHRASCVTCCSSPACCPLLSFCPCCDDADYVKDMRESSKYIYIRENSVEWNDPHIVMRSGFCFGVDPCLFSIHDSVHVVYFDDVMYANVTDQTRICNECRTCLCGGRGERIRIDSTCCFSLCLRSSFPCPCIPVCCPSECFPCAWRHSIYVKDASRALYEIKAAIKKVNGLPLYKDDGVFQAKS